ISENDLKKYQDTAKELLDDHDSVSLVSAALSLLTKERRDTPVRISGAQPISVKGPGKGRGGNRSEEHTSELQSRFDLVCRLLLEKKNKHNNYTPDEYVTIIKLNTIPTRRSSDLKNIKILLRNYLMIMTQLV